MRATPTLSTLPLLLVALTAACSLAFDVADDQCETDGDCAERGAPRELRTCAGGVCRGAAAKAFACLPRVRGAIAKAPAEVTQRLFLHDLNRTALAGALVQICATGDIECTQPLSEGTTDDGGQVEFRVDVNYNVFFQYQVPGALPGILHSTPAYRVDPEDGALVVGPLAEGVTTYDAFGISREVASTLAAAVRAELSPELGAAFVRVFGCEPGTPAAGVVVRIVGGSGETRVFYDRGGAPATADVTDATGSAYVLNLPVGLVTVRAEVKDTGRFLGERTIISRAGTLTTFTLGPTPPP
jgi:hypothetical protein